MKRIVLLSCTKRKLPHAARAELLYSPSALFRFSLAYARTFGPDTIYILSAKYGLTSLDQHLEPYEQTLKKMNRADTSAWGQRVLGQLAAVCTPAHDHFTILAGSAYCAPIIASLPNHTLPLAGLGQGRRLQFLKQQLAAL